MSLKPALGLRFFKVKSNLAQLQTLKKPVYMFRGGYSFVVPDFIRKKFFTDAQKQNLKDFYSLPKVWDEDFIANLHMEELRLQRLDRETTQKLRLRFNV